MPLGTLLFRPSCSLINHTVQKRAELGQVRQYGAWETPCSTPKKEVLIKPPSTTSQHETISTQLDYAQVKEAAHIIHRGRGKAYECVHVDGNEELRHMNIKQK